ncbi:MAG TPA: response regulator [Flavisolibacter sp.]|jgi:CheY-like chemotaxis protein|nr:response regulator [Flavisolibacter sp.]
MEMDANKPVLLYAEDDVDDFESLKDAVAQLTDKYTLLQAKNGTEVLSILEERFTETHPCLIILDLNMPIMDGKEVLIWLKNDQRYKNIPVMVFTTSSREDDLRLCQSHKCTFFRKPTLYRDLLHIAQMMLDMCDGKE